MTDIVLEILRAILTGMIFFFLLLRKDMGEFRHNRGWRFFTAGIALIFIGTLIDITDNFPNLNRFIIIGDTPYQAFLEKVIGYLFGYLFLAIGVWLWLPAIIEHERQSRQQAADAMQKVTILRGLLPICASCKKIRDDNGYWKQIESYLSEHSEAEFSHSVCPDCVKKLYPDLALFKEKATDK